MAASEPDANPTTLTIRILGRDYAVACPEHERDSLLKSAEHLSARMQAIQRRGKTLGIERIAVMAALNIAHDLIDLKAAGAPPGVPGIVQPYLNRARIPSSTVACPGFSSASTPRLMIPVRSA